MREYKIKRGHDLDIGMLVSKYFGANGDISKGIKFDAGDIGMVEIRQEKNSLFVEIVPSKTRSGDYKIVKKWNEFLFEATGKGTKERKKVGESWNVNAVVAHPGEKHRQKPFVPNQRALRPMG